MKATIPLAIAAFIASPAHAQVEDAGRWVIYGTTSTHERDASVPGGAIRAAQPPATRGKPWTSGAVLKLPRAVAAGETIAATFWARAAKPMRTTAAIQGPEPTYAQVASTDLALTPQWQRFIVTGTAAAPLPAGSQALVVTLGRADSAVMLGPVAWAPAPGAAKAFAAYRPAAVPVDLTIPSRLATLAGTLHLPVGRGPFPVAIVIQGHGPNGRGGFDEVIARLNRDGIAALEYDKRGIGQSTGTYVEDIGLLTADAQAAVAAMRARPDIDGAHVALIGHSQGGVVAPAVAAADASIDAVVTLGGSVGDGFPMLANALRQQMIAAKRPPAAIEPAVDAAMALLNARAAGRSDASVTPLRTALVDRIEALGFNRAEAEDGLKRIDTPEAWSAGKVHSARDLATTKAPVLAVYGGKDPLVIAAPEAAAARTALAANPKAKVVVFDDLSHWFQDGAVTGDEKEVATLGPNLGSPRVVALVGDFVAGALKQRR
ncbi:alpha/beta fold hydrolase [uncultured Sphingomonas sp.]|uniref:alpha/beta hydrolase family protein n=1 Tax=uncultured Sphingomonas sp. TaxID=158754 RepID=UPI0025F44F96|nr:alpha/beta fold hydrolase [uncultured Sphingomonas sp.]